MGALRKCARSRSSFSGYFGAAEAAEAVYAPSEHVEEQIYEEFVGRQDERLMASSGRAWGIQLGAPSSGPGGSDGLETQARKRENTRGGRGIGLGAQAD